MNLENYTNEQLHNIIIDINRIKKKRKRNNLDYQKEHIFGSKIYHNFCQKYPTLKYILSEYIVKL